MAPTSKLTEKYDEERTRSHEQSQMVYLQGQVDELRRLIKDQTSKYQWVIEQTRKTESSVAQLQGMFEHHREETAQTVERSRRDIIELRKEVSSALVRIDEGLKPLREMQAQIQQLAEARKQDREQIFPWFARVDELEQRISNVHNQVKEVEDQQRQLALQLDRLRDADTMTVQETRRVSEELQVERQNIRRQYVELQQLITGSEEMVKEHASRIARVEEMHEHINLISETLPAQIAAVDEKASATTGEIKRVELASTDWFMMNQERLEELRQQSNEKLSELQDVDEQNLNRLISWLERLDGWIRELEQRLGRGVSQLEATHYAHAERIAETDKRMIKVLRALSEAWQEQVISVEAEQVRTRSLDTDAS
jgi:chromosome segregation ATPase